MCEWIISNTICIKYFRCVRGTHTHTHTHTQKNPFLNGLSSPYKHRSAPCRMKCLARGFLADSSRGRKEKQNVTRLVTIAVGVKFAARYTSALPGSFWLFKSRISGYVKTG